MASASVEASARTSVAVTDSRSKRRTCTADSEAPRSVARGCQGFGFVQDARPGDTQGLLGRPSCVDRERLGRGPFAHERRTRRLGTCSGPDGVRGHRVIRPCCLGPVPCWSGKCRRLSGDDMECSFATRIGGSQTPRRWVSCHASGSSRSPHARAPCRRSICGLHRGGSCAIDRVHPVNAGTSAWAGTGRPADIPSPPPGRPCPRPRTRARRRGRGCGAYSGALEYAYSAARRAALLDSTRSRREHDVDATSGETCCGREPDVGTYAPRSS